MPLDIGLIGATKFAERAMLGASAGSDDAAMRIRVIAAMYADARRRLNKATG
jgi:hypothetical protein